MPKKLRWRRSPTGWDGKPWENWRRSRDRIRCWPGTESSSPASSTDRSFANPGVVPELTRKPSGWWCGWRKKIPGGAMTGSWAPWPTWVCGSRIRRWAIFCAAMIFHRLPSGSRRQVGKTLSVLTWRCWWRPTSSDRGLRLSDQTVGNILRRHDIPPAPKRKQAASWKDFIRAHMAVLVATDFFTVEVLTLRGLITYYVLFFIHLESRRICLAGVTRHPDQEWMEQMARNVTMEDAGFLINRRYLLHDRDRKYC